MKPLRDYSWWPHIWADINPRKIRLEGIFKDCRLSRSCLMLTVDYRGKIVPGIIPRQPEIDVEKLHDFLLPHRNKPMREVDSLEFECDSLPAQNSDKTLSQKASENPFRERISFKLLVKMPTK